MTILLEAYKPRAADALKRIAQSVEAIASLLQDAPAIRGAIINGEPQLIRDLEFIADDIERGEQRRLTLRGLLGQRGGSPGGSVRSLRDDERYASRDHLPPAYSV